MRFPGSGPGTGEVGARPTLTRNCERLCGYPPHSASQATCRCPPGHRCSHQEAVCGRPGTGPRGKGPRRTTMSHVRRAVACWSALTVALVSLAGLSSTGTAGAADPASQSTADAAVDWIVTQQQPDGGFEVVGFPGFETRDATLADRRGRPDRIDVEHGRGVGRGAGPAGRRIRPDAPGRPRAGHRGDRGRRQRGQDHRAHRRAPRSRPHGVRELRQPRRSRGSREPDGRLLGLDRLHLQRAALHPPRRAPRLRHDLDRGRGHPPGRPAGERRVQLHRGPDGDRHRPRHDRVGRRGAGRGRRRCHGPRGRNRP